MPSLTPRLDKLDKNYIINGNFDYWQRGTSSTTITSVFLADRFTTVQTGGSVSITRSTDVPDANSEFSISHAVTSALLPELRHKIESLFSRDLANKTATFKIKYKVTDSTLVPLKVVFATANAKDNFSAITEFSTLTINAAPTASGWQTYTVSLAVPAGAFNGLQIRLVRDNGAVVATTTTLYSQMQLLIGTNADPDFSYAGRDVVQELALCRRYYEKSFAVDTIPANGGSATTLVEPTNAAGYLAGNTLLEQTVPFKVTKRASPTVTVFGNSSGRAIYSALNNGAITGSGTISTGPVGASGVNGINVNQQDASAFLTVKFHYAADAEL